MAIPKWSRRTGWRALAVAGACALALFLLVGSTAIETGKGLWVALLLFATGLLASISALFATQGAPVGAKRWTTWLQPRPIAILFGAIFVGFGAMTDALALFEPRPAVESEPGAIEQGVNAIRAAVTPTRAAVPRIRLKIVGIWGETGCAVTYRFQISDRALSVDSVRHPAGTAAHHLIATIIRADGDVMDVTGETPRRRGAKRRPSLTLRMDEASALPGMIRSAHAAEDWTAADEPCIPLGAYFGGSDGTHRPCRLA